MFGLDGKKIIYCYCDHQLCGCYRHRGYWIFRGGFWRWRYEIDLPQICSFSSYELPHRGLALLFYEGSVTAQVFNKSWEFCVGVVIFGVEMGERYRMVHEGYRAHLRHHHHHLCRHSFARTREGSNYISEENIDCTVDFQFDFDWPDWNFRGSVASVDIRYCGEGGERDVVGRPGDRFTADIHNSEYTRHGLLDLRPLCHWLILSLSYSLLFHWFCGGVVAV